MAITLLHGYYYHFFNSNTDYQVPLDTYASMVARSTTREAGNLAREKQLEENGYDLMKMSTHYPTCELCAPLQGRVYSISGNDARFPAISRAYRNGYRNVHPNCRHVMTPYIESLQEESELQADIEASNQPFEDPRPEVEKTLYNKQQAQNRQTRQDLYQYERYKARLGNDAPKTFANFRKTKYNNAEQWKTLSGFYRYKGNYPQAELNHFKIYDELKELGIGKGAVLPPERIMPFILEDTTSKDPAHIMKRMFERHITDDQVYSYVNDAKVMFVQWGGKRKAYYSLEGVTVAIKSNNIHIAKTTWNKYDFDDETVKILEVINKHVK